VLYLPGAAVLVLLECTACPLTHRRLDAAATDRYWPGGLTVCAAPQEDMDGHGALQFLPCGHCFHTSCILKWFSNGPYQDGGDARCPLCKHSLVRGTRPL